MLTNMNAGDTAWVLISAALVFLMVPGFAFFYGGLFRRNNILSLLSLCFTILSLVTLQWVLVGYSLSFGPDHGGWLGTLAWAGLRGVGGDSNIEYTGTVPHIALMIYRGLSAALAPIIFLVPFTENIKLRSVISITLLWTTLVYNPVAHWIWGVGGFLRMAGVVDFAGGAPLYVNAAMAALALTLVIGKSHETSSTSVPSSNQPLAMLGTILLWFGWLGLNGGSALGANAAAANALAMTLVASTSAGLVWLLLDKLAHQQLSPLGMITGSVAGLVAISAPAGTATIWTALFTGMAGSLLGYMSLVLLRKKFAHDGVRYAIGIFGVGGLWGLIMASVGGTAGQFLLQLKTISAVSLYSFAMSWLLLKILDFVIGLRISEHPGTPRRILTE